MMAEDTPLSAAEISAVIGAGGDVQHMLAVVARLKETIRPFAFGSACRYDHDVNAWVCCYCGESIEDDDLDLNRSVNEQMVHDEGCSVLSARRLFTRDPLTGEWK